MQEDFAQPATEWSEATLRAYARRVSDLVTDLLAGASGGRVAPDARPRDLEALFDEPLPAEGADAARLLDDVRMRVAPNSLDVGHAMHFGLMDPSPLPVAVFADAIASALNQNVATWFSSPAATHVEARVIRWLCDLVGYGDDAFGLIVGGGSVANLVGLKTARNASGDVKRRGLHGTARRVLYTSVQGHYSLERAMDTLGLGRENVRRVAVDDHQRMDVDALRAAIDADRAAGLEPLAVAATVGLTNTGNVDPIERIADVCAAKRVWLHVDAAWGGGILLSDRHRGLAAGLSRADSVTLDPHKWMFIPFTTGVLLVRERAALLDSGDHEAPEYLTDDATDDPPVNFHYYGIQGSRRFDALKLWIALKHLGRRGYAAIIDRQVSLAQRLGRALGARDDFEVTNRVELALVCARYRPPGIDCPDALDAIQRAIQKRVEREGRAWVSTTELNGRRSLRVNIASFRTRADDIDALVEILADAGRAEAS